jgi:hypothetical protein
MTRRTSLSARSEVKQPKKLSLSKKTLKNLDVRGKGPKGGAATAGKAVRSGTYCSF